jgi:hypothetical protein
MLALVVIFFRGVAMSKLYMIVIFVCSMISSDASAMYAGESAESKPASRRDWYAEMNDRRLWVRQMERVRARNQNPQVADQNHVVNNARRRLNFDAVQDNGQ